jgi:hypothetical protein
MEYFVEFVECKSKLADGHLGSWKMVCCSVVGVGATRVQEHFSGGSLAQFASRRVFPLLAQFALIRRHAGTLPLPECRLRAHTQQQTTTPYRNAGTHGHALQPCPRSAGRDSFS